MKEGPAGEEATARSWPDGDDAQSADQVDFWAVLKADQPAERLLGSKRPCLISPELLGAGGGEMAGRADDVLPSPARPPSPSSSTLSSLLSLVHDSAYSWRYASVR